MRERYVARGALPTQSDPHVFDTISGQVIEDLLTYEEAVGRAAEYNEESEPRCDICGQTEDYEPGMVEYDWHGDTGNHLSCEGLPAVRIRPVGTDIDGNGIWTNGYDQWTTGKPLTPDEVAEAEAATHP